MNLHVSASSLTCSHPPGSHLLTPEQERRCRRPGIKAHIKTLTHSFQSPHLCSPSLRQRPPGPSQSETPSRLGASQSLHLQCHDEARTRSPTVSTDSSQRPGRQGPRRPASFTLQFNSQRSNPSSRCTSPHVPSTLALPPATPSIPHPSLSVSSRLSKSSPDSLFPKSY